jgi:UDPglucose--hexose-1-phosphate uridylyltransferase
MKSEIRQDLVSGDWIIVATERSKRPHEIKSREKMKHPEGGDPFEDPEKFDNEVVKTIMKEDGSDWDIKVIKNKYPLVVHGACGDVMEHGPFKYREGIGFHEVVIFRDANKYFHDFNPEEMQIAMKAYRDRYKDILKSDECQKFTLIFHNHGKEAGASLAHPHSQIISVPVYPPDVNGSLEGAERYYKNTNKKVHQVMVECGMKDKKRTVYENDKFIALCPYASRLPYEVRIYPKDFGACFDVLPDEDLKEFADVMHTILNKIYKGLNDPPYNLYIHTAPGDETFTCPAAESM